VLQTNGAGSDPSWVANAGGGAISGQTRYAVEVGAAGGSIASLSAVGATGTTLMGSTGANPAWTGSPSFSGSVTAGSGNVTVTSGNLVLPATSGVTVGIITMGGNPILSVPGSRCICIGENAGNPSVGLNTDNVAIGYHALQTASAQYCVGIGSGALVKGGGSQTAIGYQSLAVSQDQGNTACGYQSLKQLNGGNYNTALGYQAGYNYTTGGESSNICIGYGVTGTVGESNVLRIGTGTGTGNGQLNKTYISGIQTITVTGAAVLVSTSDQLGVAVSSARFKENIRDMGDDSNNLYKLRPVTFNYKEGDDKTTQYGMIAEEVAPIYPELISYDKEGKPFTIYYHVLPAMLLNEIQKLYKRIEELENTSCGEN
jgi:hypothetical protein